jgi:2-polyprenyl-3-methyl-5-hydroxy-6-metoxy-1,4-benzoquinol methylase
MPEPLLEPEGNVAAFAPWIDPLPAGARLLDCACGVGLLAVGLALRGFETHASDASPQMVARTRELAARHGVRVQARTQAWEALAPEPEFDAVFCVGNSLAHAADRPAALSAMAHVLRPGGVLVLTSRNWERERAAGSRLEVDDRLVERGGRRALVTRAWTIDEAEIALDVAVSIIHPDDTVTTVAERLRIWPFSADELDHDLRRAGLEPQQSTYTPESDRYLVTASRR